MGFYGYLGQLYRERPEELKELFKQRLIEWRREPSIIRIERPTNLRRARELGYKPIQGLIVVRVRLRKRGSFKTRPDAGRKPKKMATVTIYRKISRQAIAEARANRKYPNLEVLGSYEIADDGKYKWFEVILVDPTHPQIISRPEYAWIVNQRKRVFRGLTPAGKKYRGLRNRSPEQKTRPSVRANQRKGK